MVALWLRGKKLQLNIHKIITVSSLLTTLKTWRKAENITWHGWLQGTIEKDLKQGWKYNKPQHLKDLNRIGDRKLNKFSLINTLIIKS